jgi:hypothetical protein
MKFIEGESNVTHRSAEESFKHSRRDVPSRMNFVASAQLIKKNDTPASRV